MFSVLARLYAAGKIDQTGLDAAVARGWISQAEADEIVAADGQTGVLG